MFNVDKKASDKPGDRSGDKAGIEAAFLAKHRGEYVIVYVNGSRFGGQLDSFDDTHMLMQADSGHLVLVPRGLACIETAHR